MTTQSIPGIKYWQAINRTLDAEMERDNNVVVLGQNVAAPGGTFGSTRGLLARFGEHRVVDTPIAEQAIVGTAVGAAMSGLRPVVELVFSDFLLIASDQVVNQAAKMRYFSGGSIRLPMVIKIGIGVSSGLGAQHTQSLEAWYAHVPGLKVVWPGTPADAAGLLTAAIRDPDPVLFLENVGRYTERGPDPDGTEIRIGEAAVVWPGEDLTVVTYGTARRTCTEAVEHLAAQGVSVDLIDLRSVQPWDVATVTASVRRTGRCLVVHDAVRSFGVGAEVASVVGEQCFGALRAPVRRIGSPRVPAPQITRFEDAVRPGPEEIVESAHALLREQR